MIYLFTTVGLTPGGNSTVHIDTQTVHRTILNCMDRVRAVPRVCELYRAIFLTAEEKARENSQ